MGRAPGFAKRLQGESVDKIAHAPGLRELFGNEGIFVGVSVLLQLLLALGLPPLCNQVGRRGLSEELLLGHVVEPFADSVVEEYHLR